MAEFTEMEQSIIKNSMLRKSHKSIAELLDVDVADIAQFIKSITEGTETITLQMEIDSKKKPKKQKAAPKQRQPSKAKIEAEKLKKERMAVIHKRNAIDKDRLDNRARSRQPAFKTKQVDYSQLRTVRVNSKTTIYAKPGETDKQVIDRYHELYQKTEKETI
jgi:FtsZ-binding cell division protein ZapB